MVVYLSPETFEKKKSSSCPYSVFFPNNCDVSQITLASFTFAAHEVNSYKYFFFSVQNREI